VWTTYKSLQLHDVMPSSDLMQHIRWLSTKPHALDSIQTIVHNRFLIKSEDIFLCFRQNLSKVKLWGVSPALAEAVNALAQAKCPLKYLESQ